MTRVDLALQGTVWLALAAWATAEMTPPTRPFRSSSAWRSLWLFGAFALAAHFALAMQLRHGWSHAAAVADTARQTQAKFGLNWGGGVWFNYAMVALWLIDAAWMWVAPARWATAYRWRWFIRGFFFFMWFNGAVVFPTGPVRWFGLLACSAVGWTWWRQRQRGD